MAAETISAFLFSRFFFQQVFGLAFHFPLQKVAAGFQGPGKKTRGGRKKEAHEEDQIGRNRPVNFLLGIKIEIPDHEGKQKADEKNEK